MNVFLLVALYKTVEFSEEFLGLKMNNLTKELKYNGFDHTQFWGTVLPSKVMGGADGIA